MYHSFHFVILITNYFDHFITILHFHNHFFVLKFFLRMLSQFILPSHQLKRALRTPLEKESDLQKDSARYNILITISTELSVSYYIVPK